MLSHCWSKWSVSVKRQKEVLQGQNSNQFWCQMQFVDMFVVWSKGLRGFEELVCGKGVALWTSHLNFRWQPSGIAFCVVRKRLHLRLLPVLPVSVFGQGGCTADWLIKLRLQGFIWKGFLQALFVALSYIEVFTFLAIVACNFAQATSALLLPCHFRRFDRTNLSINGSCHWRDGSCGSCGGRSCRSGKLHRLFGECQETGENLGRVSTSAKSFCRRARRDQTMRHSHARHPDLAKSDQRLRPREPNKG